MYSSTGKEDILRFSLETRNGHNWFSEGNDSLYSMKKILEKWRSMHRRKKIVGSLLVGIVLIGAFLRLYHFSDWLHFELDQARDSIVVSQAMQNGLEYLPLLGPKASGTSLRVGPVFYYLEYGSALIFGNTPQGHALFVPILSIVSILLLYFLMRRLFPVVISLGLTYLYSISAFFVLYQRFAWNPNILPFFLIAGLLTFFWATDNQSRYPGRWFIVSSFCWVVATQLHFVAFFAVPFFVGIALLLRRPNFSWKAWAMAVLVTPSLLYSPFFFNEWVFQGSNTKAFIEALQEKQEDRTVSNSIVTSLLTQAKAYALVLTGDETIILPKLYIDGFSFEVKCGDYCKKTPDWVRNTTLCFFFFGLGILVWYMFRRRSVWCFIGLWFIAVSLAFMGVASQLAPRFFPLLIPLPFVFLGMVFLVLYKHLRKFFWAVFVVVLAFLSYTNFSLLWTRADELRNSLRNNVSISTDRILEETVRVTYEEQKAIAQYLAERQYKNGYPTFIDAESFWRRSIKYIAERNYGVSIGFLFPSEIYEKSNRYIILRTKKDGKSVFRKYIQQYDILERQEFGTISVYPLRLKGGATTQEAPKERPIIETDGGDFTQVTWKSGWQELQSK